MRYIKIQYNFKLFLILMILMASTISFAQTLAVSGEASVDNNLAAQAAVAFSGDEGDPWEYRVKPDLFKPVSPPWHDIGQQVHVKKQGQIITATIYDIKWHFKKEKAYA